MDQVQFATVAGVLLILFGVIVYNNVAAARATRRKAAPAGPAPWVGRHLQFEGSVVGEVVAEEGDRVLVRKGAVVLSVPRSQVRPEGLDLGLRPPFDRAAAEAEGAAWQARRGAP